MPILIAAGCAVVLARRGKNGKGTLLLAIGLAYIAVDNALGLHQRLAADLDLRAPTSLEEGAGSRSSRTRYCWAWWPSSCCSSFRWLDRRRR